MPAMISHGQPETDVLLEQSYLYEFVQAVRILQRSRPDRPLVGYDALPGQEIIRFCSCPELRHASSDIRSIERVNGESFEVTLAFDALVGATGILPHHYTRFIRLRAKEGDAAFREFLDIFVHRFVSNYFRACTKYRTPIGFDLFSSGREEFRELSTRCLANTAGFSHDRLGRLEADQHLFLYFSGHFADHRPTRSALEGMLAHLSGMNVSLHEFQLELLHLDQDDQTRFGTANCTLGRDAVVGSRVASVQNRFRIRLGPLTWPQFVSLLEGNLRRLRQLAKFARTYVGDSLDFDFQLIVKKEDVICARLGDAQATSLGLSTWSMSTPAQQDAMDVVIRV